MKRHIIALALCLFPSLTHAEKPKNDELIELIQQVAQATQSESDLEAPLNLSDDWSYYNLAAAASAAGMFAPSIYLSVRPQQFSSLGWLGLLTASAGGMGASYLLNKKLEAKTANIIRLHRAGKIDKQTAMKEIKKLRLLAIASGALLGVGWTGAISTGMGFASRTTDFIKNRKAETRSTIKRMKELNEKAKDDQQALFSVESGHAHIVSKEVAAKLTREKREDGHRVWFDKPLRASWSGVSFKDWLLHADPKRSYTVHELDPDSNEPVGDPIISQKRSLYSPYKRQPRSTVTS